MGRVAIVAGSDSGIGWATAVALAEAGWDVGVTWRQDEEGAARTAAAPGEVATAMTGAEGTDPHAVKRPGIPLGRPGHAREIAAAVVWLASEDAGYATGASFVIDGGLLLMAARANDDAAP